jgi:hypothetical protein
MVTGAICTFNNSQIFDISCYEPARRRRSQESVVVLKLQISQPSAAGGGATL